MSARVDVLAVMDRAVGAVEAYTRDTVFVGGDAGFMTRVDDRGLREARAAVAELIEAAKPYALGESDDWLVADERLRAALAAVQP